MKKILIFAVLMLFAMVNFDLGNVRADSIATGMGFDVNSTQYGDAKNYKYYSTYTYKVKNDVSYAIGWSKVKGAVYEDQTNSNWALVIIQSTSQPKDIKIPWGIFNIKRLYDGYTYNQNIYSDIDSSSIYFGYGAYITGSGFLMEQPSPRDEPDTFSYTASVEVSDQVKASGSVTFDDNELDLYFGHQADTQEFDVDYRYSCSGFLSTDCSYRNAMTYNKAAYLVDMANGNNSNAGNFVNRIQLTTRFHSQSGPDSWQMFGIEEKLSITLFY
jgi:hypothetical protein